jgi:hypothetical protein
MRNLKKLISSKEQISEEEYSEDPSYEISDKFEVNIDETETKKKETV